MYQITVSKISQDEEECDIFGIRWEETIIMDLSTNRNAVQALVDECNRAGLDPIHLWDVAEDFLAAPEDWDF